jgi:glucose-6-phosphate-specific signal transduction histidine kinase
VLDVQEQLTRCPVGQLDTSIGQIADASVDRCPPAAERFRCLAFNVTDDGKGFDPATTPRGTGLQGIADRLEALGGTIDISSTPGRGTRLTGRVAAAAA